MMVKVFARLFRFYGAYAEDIRERLKLLLDVVLSKYWHLTLQDLQLFVEQAMLGRYGKLYGQLTPAVVIDWLDRYAHERDRSIEAMNTAEQHGRGLSQQTAQHPDEARRALDDFLARYGAKRI